MAALGIGLLERGDIVYRLQPLLRFPLFGLGEQGRILGIESGGFAAHVQPIDLPQAGQAVLVVGRLEQAADGPDAAVLMHHLEKISRVVAVLGPQFHAAVEHILMELLFQRRHRVCNRHRLSPSVGPPSRAFGPAPPAPP